MDIIDLIKTDSSRAITDIAVELMGTDEKIFARLISISIEEKVPLCWRAARVIDLACEKHKYLFESYINTIINSFDKFKSDGQKRIYLRIISRYRLNQAIHEAAKLINICLDYLTYSQESIAVKAFAMEIIYNISKDEPDLQNELMLIIEDRMQFYSAGLKSKGRRILKDLQIMQSANY